MAFNVNFVNTVFSGFALLILLAGCGGGSGGNKLASIQVNPATASMAVGTSLKYTATGITSDGTNMDLNDWVTWSSSDSNVATVSSSGGNVSCVTAGSTTITAKMGDVTGSSALTVTSATLVSIQVTPPNQSIALNTSQQFIATGLFSDNSTQNLTDQATWSSSAAVASFDNTSGPRGLATSTAAGSTTITATFAGVSGNSILTVTSATLMSLQVSPPIQNIALGTTQQFVATGVFSDNSTQNLTDQATWSSSAAAVTFNNTAGPRGLATSVAVGSATVTATFGGKTGSTTLTVISATLDHVEVTPTNPSIASGTTRQFYAIGVFSDNSRQDLTNSATWSAATASVASVSSTGLVKGVGAGSTTITASYGGKSGTTSLTVTSAVLVGIEVSPLNPTLSLGTNLQFTAVGTYSDNTTQDLTTDVVWNSSNSSVAFISNAAGTVGLASSIATGGTTITATLGGVTGSTSLTVTSAALVSLEISPAAPIMPAGFSQQLVASGTFTDGTHQDMSNLVTWSSSSAAIALVSNAAGSKGLINGIAAGTATITASAEGITTITQVTVTSGNLTSIEVTPTDPTLPVGTTQQFIATGIFDDNNVLDLTSLATWSSSATGIATISNDSVTTGVATPVAPGTTTITATLHGISGSTSFTVVSPNLQSIAVTPVSAQIAVRTVQQYAAIGTYSNGALVDLTKFVTWSSTAPSVASISNVAGNNKGVATGLGAGITTIRAAMGGVVSNNATLTVTTATLQSIAVTPANATIARGTTLQYKATGTFSDTTTQDLTLLVTWSSANSAVSISNSLKFYGLATGSGAATNVSITAALGAISGSTTLNVVIATLQSISVTPASLTVAKGTTQQLSAIGTFTGGIVQDITKSVKWSSDKKNVAVVSNGRPNKGQAVCVGVGTATITVLKSGIVVPVTPAVLTVTP